MLPAPVLDDRFGFIIGDSRIGPRPAVRRESDPRPVFIIGEASGSSVATPTAISPDGRRIAYGTGNDLHILDLAQNAQPRIVLSVMTAQAGEWAHSVVWSTDGTGLVVGVTGPPINAGADAPPEYSALRLVDAAGGQPREIARLPHGMLVPLSWDRQALVIGAYERAQGGATSYDVIDEGGKFERNPLARGPVILQASYDGRQVLARGFPDNVLWVWPAASGAHPIELRSAASERIFDASWRPGTGEIGVLVGDRLELWDVSGLRRPVPLPARPPTTNLNRSLIFRRDGSAVFIGLVLDPRSPRDRPDVYWVAVDLATGGSVVVLTDGVPPFASVRIDR